MRETPGDGGLLPRLGFWGLLAALALAPLLGGTPVGSLYAAAAYGGDTMLGVLRTLTLAAVLLLALLGPPPPVDDAAGGRGQYAPGPVLKAALGATLLLSLARTWMLLSLLVHSALLTSQTLLFAMVPEVLHWFCFSLVFGQGMRLAPDRRDAVLAAGALTAGTLLVAVMGALEYGGASDRAAHRTVSTFFSPNFTAGFLALTLPVAVALCVGARSLLGMVGSGAAAAFGFGVLISTGSRAGVALALVGLVVALGFAVVRCARSAGAVRLPWARVGALVALLAVLGFAFREPILGRVAGAESPASSESPTVAASAAAPAASSTPDEHSGEFRRETWKGSLKMAQANPVFGAGPGTFPHTYGRYATVAWTGLAHSSYLQIASEAGFPALILAGGAALAALLIGAGAAASKPDEEEAAVNPFLICGLVGGLVAAAGRSFFDSEWSVLGNALPFWAVAGMVTFWRAFVPATDASVAAAPRSRSAAAEEEARQRARGRRRALAAALGAGIPLVVNLVLLSGNTARDGATLAQMNARPEEVARQARAALGAWPPDPQTYYLAGQPECAAALEPSGKRFYQLGRFYERAGDEAKAIESLEKAVEADPNSLQTLKALAEAYERAGRADRARATWEEMTRVSEGPAGTIRAIPELTDTLPAFAYAALGQEAARSGDFAVAEKRFGQAQDIVEKYAETPRLYQISEIATSGGNVVTRRAEVRALYEDVIVPGRQEALKRLGRAAEAEALTGRRIATREKLDAFVTPEGLASGE